MKLGSETNSNLNVSEMIFRVCFIGRPRVFTTRFGNMNFGPFPVAIQAVNGVTGSEVEYNIGDSSFVSANAPDIGNGKPHIRRAGHFDLRPFPSEVTCSLI